MDKFLLGEDLDDVLTIAPNPDKNITASQPEPELLQWGLKWQIVISVVISLIAFTSVVGNSMVVTVIVRHRGMRTRTNMFLCGLALNDLLCSFINMPIALVTVIYGGWIFNEATCHINAFFSQFSYATSMHILMYLALHKLFSILRPFSQTVTHFRVLLLVVAAVCWASIISYLSVQVLNSASYRTGNIRCTLHFPESPRSYFLEIFTFATCFVLPVFIMILCYSMMCCEIKVIFELSS